MQQFLLRPAALALLVPLLLALAGCGTEPNDVVGNAYVAPATLNLRAQLGQKNSTVAVLKHGDRVSIVDVRRRFVKIRSSSGSEGWVDSLDLLTPDQMEQIQREREQALQLPSEGTASAYETLNIHIAPRRQSPPFAQIVEGGAVSVLGYRAAPKVSEPPKIPVFTIDRPQAAPHKTKRDKQNRNNPRPPKPAPPKPPDNLQALSYGYEAESKGPNLTGSTVQSPSKAAARPKPIVMEEWALVRTKTNQVGWVLARNLMMSIPDEVAQYAEGRRITSYFDLGRVEDEQKGLKHNWLWTTLGSTDPIDFDSWRVFLWNRRRHHYETSYRERDVEGYFPVHVDPPDGNSPSRSFSLITRDDDGKLRRRTYLFDGVRVHLTATENYQARPGTQTEAREANGAKAVVTETERKGWFARNWALLKRRLKASSD
jgi:hypothetical protein